MFVFCVLIALRVFIFHVLVPFRVFLLRVLFLAFMLIFTVRMVTLIEMFRFLLVVHLVVFVKVVSAQTTHKAYKLPALVFSECLFPVAITQIGHHGAVGQIGWLGVEVHSTFAVTLASRAVTSDAVDRKQFLPGRDGVLVTGFGVSQASELLGRISMDVRRGVIARVFVVVFVGR
jgi:hypothetical protein